jgi:uncharacterized membrane protein HdeD (DUF308 family)
METKFAQVLKEDAVAGSRALMATGVAMVVIGILVALSPLASGLVFDVLFGGLLVAGGIVELIDAFQSARWQRGVLVALGAIVTLTVGVLYVMRPMVGLAALTAVFIAYLVFAGAFRIVLAFELPSGVRGRFWTFLSGVVAIGLAFVAIHQMPATSLWLIGTFIGASLLTGGISRISLASGLRAAADLVGSPAPAGRGAHA